jgi:hypothetical protein
MNEPQFNRLAVYGVRDLGDRVEIVEDAGADFFSIYGFVTSISGSEFAVCVGDHDTRAAAELAVELLGY